MPSAPLLWRPVSSPCMHTGVLVGPGRERWGNEWRRRRELPDRTRETADGPGCRAVPSPEAPRAEGGRSRYTKPPPLAPRTRQGSACGRRTPPLTWTLPSWTLPILHKPRSTTRTPDPLFILDTLTPLDTLFYYFCLIKASPRPDATPTVSVVCSSRHNIYIYILITHKEFKRIIKKVKCTEFRFISLLFCISKGLSNCFTKYLFLFNHKP